MSVVALRPGLLVSLSTRMSGGVEYRRTDLDVDKPATDGAKVERWETVKVVADPEEHERASKTRGKCGSLIRAVCTKSAFGLLCPSADKDKLDAAIAEARQLAADFNATAKTVQIGVYVLKGQIAESDREAARAILSEMRELIEGMRRGIRSGDVVAVREAASQAKKIAVMLDDENAKTITTAVTEARDYAKAIAKKLVEGDDAKEFAEKVEFRALDESRFAFLDFDEAPVTQAAVIDMPALEYDA